MNELYEWLEGQNGGMRTYTEFQRQAYSIAGQDMKNSAILALLGAVASRFAGRFEGEPFSVDEASAALEQFKAIVKDAIAATGKSDIEQLAFANSIATFDLLQANAA